MAAPLVIAGGGPAGLACGIRLLQGGRAVTLHERGRYPLKKVCGEFLSPEGWRRLELLEADYYLPARPRRLTKERFYEDGRSHLDLALEPAAFGLSRGALDGARAQRFKALGGELREGSELDPREADLNASGRPSRGGPWFGYKAYLGADCDLLERAQTDLLMLPLKRGYAGVARVEDGRLSVCLIARSPAPLKQLLKSHPLMAKVSDRLEFHASIAGFELGAGSGFNCIGDSYRVWPPVVGDGITRALAAGEAAAASILAGEPLRRTSAWGFGLAKGLHYAMLSPTLRRAMAAAGRAWPGMAGAAYRRTRVGRDLE